MEKIYKKVSLGIACVIAIIQMFNSWMSIGYAEEQTVVLNENNEMEVLRLSNNAIPKISIKDVGISNGISIEVKGENLWDLNSRYATNNKAYTTIENNMIRIIGTKGVNRYTRQYVEVEPDTEYVISGTKSESSSRIYFYFTDKNKTRLLMGNENIPVTAPSNAKYAELICNTIQEFSDPSFNEYEFSNLMFLEGSTVPDEFIEVKSSQLLIEDSLAFSDNLIYDLGNVNVVKKWNEYTLKEEDFQGDIYSGYSYMDIIRGIYIPDFNSDNVLSSSIWFEGFGEMNYIPSDHKNIETWRFENKSYTNGLSIRLSKGSYSNYESAINDLVGKKVYYQVSTPYIYSPQIYGDPLRLHQGSNHISIRTGVLREKSVPTKDVNSGGWYIDESCFASYVQESYDTKKIHEVIRIEKAWFDSDGNRNSVDDTKNWSFSKTSEGGERAVIDDNAFDPTASYYITYEVDSRMNKEFLAVIEYDESSDMVNDLLELTMENRKTNNELRSEINALIMKIDEIEKNISDQSNVILKYDDNGNLEHIETQ
ncbi:hypothetical protein [Fusibacter sp. JL216-2]|uniref:hypothetical protein n=1 Tax=Fusibacter sp. JL216-2 TaxID=3071453 RepID=UPI003D344075